MAEFKSILFDEPLDLSYTEPSFFKDLQLHYLFDIIRVNAAGYDISGFFYTFPVGKETAALRETVFYDIDKNPGFMETAEYFCFYMRRARELRQFEEEAEEIVKKASFRLHRAAEYIAALQTLYNGLEGMVFACDAISDLRELVKTSLNNMESSGFIAKMSECFSRWRDITFRLTVRKNDITVTRDKAAPGDKAEGNYLRDLAKLLKLEIKEDTDVLPPVFKNPLETSYLEDAIGAILKKTDPGVFSGITALMQDYPEFFDDRILRFEREIQFYKAVVSFREETEKLGKTMCFSASTSDSSFKGEGVYDLALLYRDRAAKNGVVANDFEYPPEPSFMIVTGPNQGGKTTFARSLGQAVYFAMMGMPVNARLFIIPELSGIMTHFENEENLMDNAGKLKDEILRLSPMLNEENGGYFIVLNELFTTATTRDAENMGRRITDMLLARKNFGIYVTHMSELAREQENIKSLVAEVVGENNERTYRIIPGEAKGLGFSDSLVKKYEMSYEDLMGRLPNKIRRAVK